MDYLDPKKKRKHKIVLLVGYALFAVAIGMATILLVYLSNGYYVDRDTGQVIQNGLVYVDSRPGGAEIYLNGQKQRGATDSRLVIPDGEYEITLKKAGYRDWIRSIILEGGSLRRLTYAKLIPEKLTTEVGSNLHANPVNSSQSIDKRWIVLTYAENPLIIDVIDTEQPDVAPMQIDIPSTLVTDPTKGIFEVLEWADDDKTFIASYTVGTKVSYLLINKDAPAQAQNLNTLFNDSTYEISFQDRKKDKFFVYQASTQSLLNASLSNGVASAPFVTNVQEYKTFGRDWVLYITKSDQEGLVDARFKHGDNDILLKKIKTDKSYLLQLAKLGNSPILGISSPVENRALVYHDPEKYLNENTGITIPLATTVLRVVEPTDLRISADSSVIMAYGPKNFASHEFEVDRSYNFKVDVPVDAGQELRWLDGQHILFSSEGTQVMMDFDGSNIYELVASMPRLGSYYTNDIEVMYSFNPAIAATETKPAVPATISVTDLLLEADK